jgi:hypothetical protein
LSELSPVAPKPFSRCALSGTAVRERVIGNLYRVGQNGNILDRPSILFKKRQGRGPFPPPPYVASMLRGGAVNTLQSLKTLGN